ncbi:DUF775-domain-containing protein, partial [Hysterangium stoloniferum]
GRPLQTNMQQIDETHAVFMLDNPSALNHVCVFLLGTALFPDGYAATVHLNWPGRGFQLLGMLSNEKPSAIFRLRGTFTSETGSGPHVSFSTATSDISATNALVGISIEPIDSVYAQCANTPSGVTPAVPNGPMIKQIDPTTLAEKIVKHLFNYMSSFSVNGGLAPDTFVPIGVITKWYDTFLTKVKTGGIAFLERDE